MTTGEEEGIHYAIHEDIAVPVQVCMLWFNFFLWQFPGEREGLESVILCIIHMHTYNGHIIE